MNGVSRVSEHTFEIGGDYTAPSPAAEPLAPQIAPVVTTPAPIAPVELAKPTDLRAVLKQLNARLTVVKREIKAREKLEAERDQIQRLIRSAKTEIDNVRRLRSA